MAQKPNLVKEAATTNVLHYFRSYNYLFTLSAISNSEFKGAVNPKQVSSLANKYVVAQSMGKGTDGLDTMSITPLKRDLQAEKPVQFDNEGVRLLPVIVDDLDASTLVDKFNKTSPGRFDFFFDNVELETLMSFNQKTGFSKATSLSFNIVEPYSLAGFLEALQVAAVAAGHPTYKSAPFIFKIEFKGYPDWNPVATDIPELIEPASRYFIIRFKEMKIQATEQGTKYSCSAVPLSELAFGEANKLKNSITIEGNTVGKILQDMFDKLNIANKEYAGVSLSAEIKGNKAQTDEYTIGFPTIVDGKFDYEGNNENISEKKIAKLSVDDVAYAFKNPVDHADERQNLTRAERRKVVYDPTVITSQFSSGANIHDCISAIVRDSEYGTSIFTKLAEGNAADENDLVDYFNILVETIPKELWNSAMNRPFYIYKFYVVPYKIHKTKIPGQQSGTVDDAKAKKIIRRTYNYLYTGQNKDILNFNLSFDNLYFQNNPTKEGNQPKPSGADEALSTPSNELYTVSLTTESQQAQGSGNSVNERQVDIRSTQVGFAGETTRPLQKDPYSTLVKNLHQAIIDNITMSQLEIEILGDPLYLVQNGVGNLRVDLDPDNPGMTLTGDLDFQSRDVFVEVLFRNPRDIKKDGLMEFDDEVTSFSGLYQVLSVNSKFAGGLFTQRLHMIRMPAQRNDTKQTTVSAGIAYNWTPGMGG